LEGKNGFFQAFAGGEISTQRLLCDLGTRYEIMDIYFKPYPCCRHLHSAIDAIREVKDQYGVRADQVSRLRIGVNRTAALHAHKECGNLLDAQMSLPYSAAAAFVHAHLPVDVFQPKSAPEELWRLCREAEIYVDEEADREYPAKRAARLELELADGTKLAHFVDNPLGEPSKPLNDEQLETKFLQNCAPILGEKKALQYVATIWNLPGDASVLLGNEE
jgi:2-methylcitrate dehydratase PrpD